MTVRTTSLNKDDLQIPNQRKKRSTHFLAGGVGRKVASSVIIISLKGNMAIDLFVKRQLVNMELN